MRKKNKTGEEVLEWGRQTRLMQDFPTEYRSYSGAKNRCENPKNTAYSKYGGRGIKFLYTSFEQFLNDLGPRPEGLTLDRENNNDHYRPGNCRWATWEEQVRNRNVVRNGKTWKGYTVKVI